MEIFDSVIFEYGNYTFSLQQLLLAVLSIVSALLLTLLVFFIFKQPKLKKKLGDSSSKMIRNFSITIIIFFGIYALLESIGIDFSYYLNKKIIKTDRFSFMIFHILIFYGIIVGTKVLLSIVETIISTKEQASQIDRGKTKNVYQIIRYFIYLIAIAIFIQSLGINITILIASLSALLLGLGLGLQHLFNDVVSGLILLFDRSIKIGDVIEVKEDVVGKVSSINLRTSILITRDEIEVIIPNSKFTSDNIINWTHNRVQTRFYIDVGVAYGSDVRLVEKILIEVAMSHPQVEKDPPAKVQFRDFGNSSLDFRLRFYSNETFRIEGIKSDLRFGIDKIFRENNVTIPFPQRDVHLYPKSEKM